MFIFAGQICAGPEAENFATCTVPAKFRSLHCLPFSFFCFVLSFVKLCTVHVFVFCDIYIYISNNIKVVFEKNKKYKKN